eukprot:TRINITY_DN7182_c0_g1_i1.p1 TRINITY_DN7182_c0_g1~~TRINITY_DN7182_c0_g1_i1.p1  ORF type:complete len:319 (-),score=76.05 TRINITY_DN7182_c0_g1_i1:30-956(-)
MSNIGMMDSAYFVAKGELLQWLNDFFRLNITKVEQVCTGAVFCQIIDAVHPGAVQLSRVNFSAKFEHEWIKNYKILQLAFNKVGIEKHIEVDKLIKGKYQDNLEALQWFKAYFDRNYPGGDYDPIARRNGQDVRDSATSVAPAARAPGLSAAPVRSASTSHSQAAPGGVLRTSSSRANPAPRQSPVQPAVVRKPAANLTPSRSPARPPVAPLAQPIQSTNAEIVELKLLVDGLEKERDFYFGKLREIEILCQTHEESTTIASQDLIQTIQKILYATEERQESELMFDVGATAMSDGAKENSDGGFAAI